MEESGKISMKEIRGLFEFNSKDEYVEAMVEDLSDWLNYLYNLKGEDELTSRNFFTNLKDGVILCKHAQLLQSLAEDYLNLSGNKDRKLPMKIGNQTIHVPVLPPKYSIVDFTKTIFRFHGRDNVSNFIQWCRNFNIPASLTFETDDLVCMKNPRIVVVALLEVSRIGRIFGMEVPDIIQFDQEIDDEINQTNNSQTEASLPVVDNDFVYKDSEIDSADINYNYHYPEADIIKVNERTKHNESDRDNDEFSKQESNSTSTGVLSKQQRVQSTFGFKPRRASINIPRSISTFNESDQKPLSLEGSNVDQRINNPNSIYLYNKDVIDSSDNESNFSQSSHLKFVMPKYKNIRPVGRVKIYDNFDRLNYVKENKIRERVDLRSLDERVREILSECQCDVTFLMKRISEGRYQWGDKKTMIFIRILRTHVMVRVGGGWDTLGNFLSKHDPCRKGKCNNFKFCLPAHCKRSRSASIDNNLMLLPSGTYHGNISHLVHNNVAEKKVYKASTFDFADGIENQVLKEELNETDDKIHKDNCHESNRNTEIIPSSDVIVSEEINNNVLLSLIDDQVISSNIESVNTRPKKTGKQKQKRHSTSNLSSNQRPVSAIPKLSDPRDCVPSNNNHIDIKDDIRKRSSRIPKLKS